MLIVWSLNGARFAGSTRGEEPQTLRWLKALSQPGSDLPDVLCLQDFRVSLLAHLRRLPYFHFVPMTNSMYFGERELLGICIASRWPVSAIDVIQTWGEATVKDLEGVNGNNERTGPPDESDRLVLKTQNRVGLACTVCPPDLPAGIRIATHHGFWTRNGATTGQQLLSTQRMATFLAEQGRTHGGLLYMADFNPDKAGQVYRIYRESGAKDCLPAEFATTLAPDHPAAKLGVRSDCIMLWPDADGNYTYDVNRVQLDGSPGSDHLMLRAHCAVRSTDAQPAQRAAESPAEESQDHCSVP